MEDRPCPEEPWKRTVNRELGYIDRIKELERKIQNLEKDRIMDCTATVEKMFINRDKQIDLMNEIINDKDEHIKQLQELVYTLKYQLGKHPGALLMSKCPDTVYGPPIKGSDILPY